MTKTIMNRTVGAAAAFTVATAMAFIALAAGSVPPTPTAMAQSTAPDLVPTAFAAPPAADAGQPVGVSWTVQNQGTATAQPGLQGWVDSLYLSTDSTFNVGDRGLGQFERRAALAPGESYSRTETVTLPNVPAGEYHLLLRVDDPNIRQTVFESGETNNLRTHALVIGATPTPTPSNPVPELTALSPDSATEDGPAFTLTVTGTRFVQGSVVRWNGADRPTTYVSATQLTAAIPAPDLAAVTPVSVTVFNPAPGGGVSNALAFTIRPANRPPVAKAGADQIVSEGVTVALEATGSSDPDGDLLAYAWTVASCPWPVSFTAPGQAATTFAAVDDGVCTLRVTVSDGKEGGTATDDVAVTVTNVAPTVRPITAPVDPVRLGTAVTTEAEFADPGVRDAHTAVWDWGDGTTSPGTVTETNGASAVAGAHTYAAPGVYRLALTVTDDDTGVGAATFEYVVVYNPDGGFVTGGGVIDSPPSAYAPNPALSGRATFGFVAKYQQGATVPAGQTQFRFHVADLHFHSTGYEWLVVGGARAQFKGTGTINGSGDYGFLLTAIDGQVPGGNGTDRFRIKIWDRTESGDGSAGVIYDNQMGAGQEADPTTGLAGGSISIHKG